MITLENGRTNKASSSSLDFIRLISLKTYSSGVRSGIWRARMYGFLAGRGTLPPGVIFFNYN